MERTSSSYPLPVPSLLAAAAVIRGILESIDAERAQVLLNTSCEDEKRNNECGFSGIDDGRRRFNNARVAMSVETLASAAAAVTATVTTAKAALEAATYARTTTARSNGGETAAAGAWRLGIGVGDRPPPSISQAQREHAVMQERNHEQGKQYEQQHMQEQPGQQKEREQLQYQSYERDQRLEQPFSYEQQQQYLNQQNLLNAHRAIPLPALQPSVALPHSLLPSRRPGRPFRKRGKRRPPPEDYCCAAPDALNRESLLLLTAAGVDALGAKGTRDDIPGNGTTSADWGGRPQSSLLLQRQRKRQHQGIDPAARFATDSALHPPPPPSLPAPTLLARSTTRVISSETYLRRLFVTASLARVLSLDEHLPRTMAAKRAISTRAGVSGCGGGGGGGAEVGGESGRESVLCGETRCNVGCGGEREATGHGGGPIDVEAGGGINTITTCIDCSADTTKRPLPPPPLSTHDGNAGPFKKSFPVTLVDNAGRRWRMMYVTTRRDNLHSGRLVDGWESFCCANGLRIGDQVEFTRVEAPDRQEGERRGKEAVAMVTAYRKHARLRELSV